MADKKNILTYAGLKKLEEELENLKVVRRKEIADKIKEAREQGDLSENAEYDAAKEEQGHIEKRIEEIEKILKNAEVVDEEEIDLDKINIGCKVKVFDMEFDEEIEFKLVGSTEADSLNNKISNESPIAKAIMNHKVGDIITVESPNGSYKIEITEIHIQSPDFKSGILNNQPKDRTILNWLIQWVEDGLNKDILHFGDLIPSKKACFVISTNFLALSSTFPTR